MKTKVLKRISLFLALTSLILCIPLNAAAKYSDIPDNASYAGAVDRLASLGIVNSDGRFNPDGLLTRAQFSKMIVVAAGLEDTAATLKGSTVFPDIAAGSWAVGYINTAVNKGYITGMLDGKFHPEESITFAQVCTVLVKALGYSDTDVSGKWPYNYINKAGDLGLTDGISLSNSQGVPRWAAAVMIDRLLGTNLKSTGASTTAQTFISSTGYYVQCTVYGDSTTMNTLTSGQVMTDKGTFYNSTGARLEPGSNYYLVVKNGKIIKASQQSNTVLKIPVDQVSDNRVSYKDNGENKVMALPDDIAYYYNGQKVDYAKIADSLQKNSSIVFTYNTNKTSFDYAVIFDPVYSKPEVAENFQPSSKKLGSISFSGDPAIVRDGKIIDITQIENKDIVYKVTDIWGGNKYILVMDSKIAGEITAIKPSRMSPRTLQINGTDYDFSKDIDLSRLLTSFSNLTVGNNIILSLGYDGKIVNIENFGAEDNSKYALVLDGSYEYVLNSDGTKKFTYTAKLLFADGFTSTYYVNANAVMMKGSLVTYKSLDSKTLELDQVSVGGSTGDTKVSKDERTIDGSYVAENVRIFNLVYNDDGKEYTAELLDWSDFPGGTIPSGKILYINKSGAFDDINIILANDLLNKRYEYGILKAVTTTPTSTGSKSTYTICVDGKEYIYMNSIDNAVIGTIYKVKMSSSGIDTIVSSVTASSSSTKVQAIDSKRIKINDKVIFLDTGMSVYYKDSYGAVTIKTLSDIAANRTYGKVELYIDYNSYSIPKVRAILLTE